MLQKISFILVGLLFSGLLFAQSIDDFIYDESAIRFQKLYLHTDREFYFIGDTLWFSPYLLSANSNQFLEDDCNLYVDLIDNQGRLVMQENFFLNNGICSGYVNLDGDSIQEGNFILRAYTNRMTSFGDSAFFQKSIKIFRTSSTAEQLSFEKGINDTLFLEFYPEGGFLLDNKPNQMAFIARNSKGEKVNFKGKIESPDGFKIPIRTYYKGLGSFMFIPKLGQKYSVKADKDSHVQFCMPQIQEKGAKLTLSKLSEKTVCLYIWASDDFNTSEYYIAFFHRGKSMGYLKVEKNNLLQPITVETELLGEGINRFVLLDAQFKPLSERLIFVNKTDEDCQVEVELQKKEFKTREQVNLNLNIPKMEEEWARVSISVVNKNMTGHEGRLTDIRSYLLLDSELKGQVQNPALYFIDDDSISSARKLDLLMLTRGWRNYIWNDLKGKDTTEISQSSYGLTFSGKVKKAFLNKPYANTDVSLSVVNKNGNQIKYTKTNDEGFFRFDSVAFPDTALVMIQNLNKDERNSGRIELAELGWKHFPVNKGNYMNIEDIGNLSVEMFNLKKLNEITKRKFFPDKDSKVLDEIEVVAENKENIDSPYRFYNEASHSVKLTDKDRLNYYSVFEYLTGRFPGVQVTSDFIYIRGRTSLSGFMPEEALLLLDGMPADYEQMKYLQMNDIDAIEILKGGKAAIFGIKGANGVVSIFTRKGGDREQIKKGIPGIIVKRIKGFEPFRVFYSPVYSENNMDSTLPDFRQTLYWNPSVIIGENGETLSFYTCDNLAYYKVFVEGITTSGKICLGEASFSVTERR